MMGLNKLGTVVTALTAVTLLALAAEIIYVLWRRRQRLRPRVRVEPQEASLACSSPSPREREHELELELEQEVMKWHCLNGPSRVLFTIKEEEREGFESENCSSAERSALRKLSERVAVEEVAVVMEGLLNETTPFSTPCGSPPYYTPHASPSRVECHCYNDCNGGNG